MNRLPRAACARPASPRLRRPACANERGISMVEMIFATSMGLIIVGGAYSVLYSSQQTQTVNEQAVQTQQNVRVAMELITQDLKDAGFNAQNLVTPGIGTVGAAGTCGINGILPRDNNPAGADTGPDAISMIVPQLISTLSAPITGAAPTTDIMLQGGSVAAVTAEGFGATAPYDYPNPVISIAGYHSDRVSSSPVADTLRLASQVKLPSEASLPIGMQVYWLRCITYEVIHASSGATKTPLCGGVMPCLVRGTPPCLTTSPNPCVAVVEGIEDLQFSYACDGCVGLEDNIIDDQAGGTANQFDANDLVSNNAWNTGTFLPKTIRMVQVSVVARHMGRIQGSEGVTGARANYTPVPLVVHDHNHAAGVFTANDLNTSAASSAYSQMMHRVLTRTVQLKNLGLF